MLARTSCAVSTTITPQNSLNAQTVPTTIFAETLRQDQWHSRHKWRGKCKGRREGSDENKNSVDGENEKNDTEYV